jgi:predicted transcriptional regulator
MARKQMTVTDRQAEVLSAVASGTIDVPTLAHQHGVTVSAIRTQLRTLRNNGLIEGESGELTVTSDGMQFTGNKGAIQGGRRTAARGAVNGASQHREGSMIAQASDVFNKFVDQSRKFVLEKFEAIGLTPKAAATYYQNLRHENGMAYQQARPTAGATRVRPSAARGPGRPSNASRAKAPAKAKAASAKPTAQAGKRGADMRYGD